MSDHYFVISIFGKKPAVRLILHEKFAMKHNETNLYKNILKILHVFKVEERKIQTKRLRTIAIQSFIFA